MLELSVIPGESVSFSLLAQDVWTWRSSALALARDQNVDAAGVDWLLRDVAHIDRLQLHCATPTTPLASACDLAHLDRLWQEHCHHHTPLQYLAGFTHWRGLRLQVSTGVLIPRPETELLVDIAKAALTQAPHLSQGLWVDLGTGSGAIALALALECPDLQVWGIDCSPQALAQAQANGHHLGISPRDQPAHPQRLQWHLGSWFSPLAPRRGTIAGILSNPPYIPRPDLAQLDPQVRDHEPTLALDGGDDGLEAIRSLIQQAPAYLQPGGFWAVEVMVGQGTIVAELLQAQGNYHDIRCHQDFEGVDRFVSAWRNHNRSS